MSIRVRLCTVLVREADLDARTRDRPLSGFQGLRAEGLVRWVCQSPAEGIGVVKRLEALGFRDPTFTSDDIAVVDEQRGLLAPCAWLNVTGDAAEGWQVSLREDCAAEGAGRD